ncbi:MAG: hypothetical protein KDE53_13255, partial [Caldilineaceae bacterium]|nr:hypothetical protein [Caldilineaceae bacterium]
MNASVRFEHVSKQYRLGLTRTSLPTLIKQRVSRLAQRDEQQRAQDQLLWALRDVNFDLGPGQSLALVGPNGAGK